MLKNVFSRRKGYVSPPVQGNREELSRPARTRLWNIFFEEFFKVHLQTSRVWGAAPTITKPASEFFKFIWTEFFHQPVDQYPGYQQMLEQTKNQFFNGDWHFPFDVFELVFRATNYLLPDWKKVAGMVKEALERENTAYTLVDGRFVERMTQQEVQAVEEVLQSPIEGVRLHFTNAPLKLSDRENPDFRNSVKESISAVEAAARFLTK